MTNALNARAVRAMRRVYEEGKNGVLVSEAADVKRLVYFDGGDLVAARSERPDERMGAMMVRRGRITAQQLATAKRFIRSGRKFGQILVELGYIEDREIESFVRMQIIEIACGILLARSSRLAFSNRVEVEPVTVSAVSIGDVLLESVNRLDDVEHFRDVLLDDYVARQTHDALGIASGMNLSDLQAQVLDLVDAQRTLGSLFAESPLPEADTVRILVALYQAGVVALFKPRPRVVPVPAPPESSERSASTFVDPFEKELIRLYSDMQCQNHWQVLGLAQGAHQRDIESSYRELSQKLDPSSFRHVEDSGFQEKLSFVCARLKDAYVTLSSRSSANVYEKLDEREHQYQKAKEDWDVIEESARESSPVDVSPGESSGEKDVDEAKRMFLLAKQAFQEKDFWQAIELCRRAIELDHDNDADRYHLLGRALAENPKWRKDAEQNLKIAQKLEPWAPRHLVALGKLYQKEGLLERAERTFQQVRTIDPDFPLPQLRGSEPSPRRAKAG